MTAAPPDGVDVLIRNAEVWGHVGATSVAVAGGRITAIAGDELRRSIGTTTRVVDADGRALIPGINDSHFHLAGTVVTHPSISLDLSGVTTYEELVGLVANRAASLPAGSWVRGHGWRASRMTDLTPGSQPNRHGLDAAVPNHPVVLNDFSGHTVLVNEAAMHRVGGWASAKDAPHEFIERDGTGSPTGVFYESAQQGFVDAPPPPSTSQMADALGDVVAALHALGITSVTDAALRPFVSHPGIDGGREMVDLLCSTIGPGGLALRVNALMNFSEIGHVDERATLDGVANWADVEQLFADAPGEWVRLRGIKLFADGIPPNRTAFVNRPYPGGSCGCLTVSGIDDVDRERALRQVIAAAHRRGLQIGVHVTGDRGCEIVVDALSAALAGKPNTSCHYLIHASMASPATLATAGRLGLGINAQPILNRESHHLASVIGDEAADHLWPLQAMRSGGCTLALSSDSPVTSFDWRAALVAAVERDTSAGGHSGLDNALSVDQVLRGYGAAGAWQDGRSDLGAIGVGMLADLCLVDTRIEGATAAAIGRAGVAMTIVDGRVVHDAM